VLSARREVSFRVSFAEFFPRAISCRTHNQSCSGFVRLEGCFRAVNVGDERMASEARMSSRKSSESQVESPRYSTITGYDLPFLQFADPLSRRTQLQSVREGWLPMAIASGLPRIPSGSLGNQLTRQMYLCMPEIAEPNVICVGNAEGAWSATQRIAPSAPKFGQRRRTATVVFLVRLRVTKRGGLRSTSISARITTTCEQRDAVMHLRPKQPKNGYSRGQS
jgi:hypothetical protein